MGALSQGSSHLDDLDPADHLQSSVRGGGRDAEPDLLCDVTTSLDSSPAAAAIARRVLRAALPRGLPPGVGDRALVVVSELVTNAVLHGGPPVTLSVRLSPRDLRIAVADSSPERPVPRAYGPQALTGRGLGLVKELAATWGTDPRPGGGKEVWACLPLHPDPAEAPAAPAPPREPPPATSEGRWQGRVEVGRVVHRDVPVRTYLQLQAHNDALAREAELTAGVPAAPGSVAELLAQLLPALERPPRRMRAAVAAAHRAGQELVTIEVEADPGLLPVAERHVALLDLVDEHARRGELLSAPADPPVRALRHRLLREMREQLGDHLGGPVSGQVGGQVESGSVGQVDGP